MMLITGEKTPEQIDAMRSGGKMIARIFAELRQFVRPGLTELEIDSWVAEKIESYGAEPTYKTSEVNFPGVICISTNDQVVHGIPTDYTLELGDVVSFDLVITYAGMKTDSAFTMVVGEDASGIKKHLLNHTERSLYEGIDAIKGPIYTSDLGAAIEKVLRNGKLGIVKDLVGHGVGLKMHMPPDVPNFRIPGRGVLLQPGDTIAIEPMATLGKGDVIFSNDGWTINTRDGSLAAHFEHTILITSSGAEIITAL